MHTDLICDTCRKNVVVARTDTGKLTATCDCISTPIRVSKKTPEDWG